VFSFFIILTFWKIPWILDISFHANYTVCMLSWSDLQVLHGSRCALSERFNHWPTLLKINDQTSLTNRRHLFALKIIATIPTDWQTREIELWSSINTHDGHLLMKSRNNKLLVEYLREIPACSSCWELEKRQWNLLNYSDCAKIVALSFLFIRKSVSKTSLCLTDS